MRVGSCVNLVGAQAPPPPDSEAQRSCPDVVRSRRSEAENGPNSTPRGLVRGFGVVLRAESD
eukprot:15462838-Alexandrium_andersonii.AAC.1